MSDATGPGDDTHSPSEPRKLVTQKEFATRKGWSKQYVHQLVKRGRISLIDGKIDPDLADAALALSRDPSRDPSVRMARGTEEPEADGEEENLADSPYQRAYGKVRVLREHYRAQREKLEFEELVGRLVRNDEVRDEAYTSGRLVRDALLANTRNMAAALNARLGVDPREAAAVLRGELEKVLTEIAQRLESRWPVSEGLEADPIETSETTTD